jgi:hypothetical protein
MARSPNSSARIERSEAAKGLFRDDLEEGRQSAREALGDLVAPEQWAHRTRMFERHLEWPIRLW